MKRFGRVKKLILLFASLAFCILVIEVLARFFLSSGYPMAGTDPESVKNRYLAQVFSSKMIQRHSDPDVCYTLIPNGKAYLDLLHQNYSINSHGLRGPEIPKEKPEGVCRVAICGDSFVFGWGEDDAFTIPAIMERVLNQYGLGYQRFEVINSGIPGYNTAQMKEMLYRNSMNLDPDVIVVMVSANDVVADYLHFDTLFKSLYGDFLPLPYSWKSFLWRSSVAYRFVVQKHKTTREQEKFTQRDIDFFGDQVKEILSAAHKKKIKALPIILPMLEPFEDYLYEKQHKDMNQALKDVDHVDLLPRMRPHQVAPLWFRPDDHHLNRKANKAVVCMILDELVKRKMIRLNISLPKDPLAKSLFEPGDMLVADKDGGPDFNGAILKVDPATKKITTICEDPLLKEPVDLCFDSLGNLLVLDAQNGAILKVDPYTGKAATLLQAKEFLLPNSFLMDEMGRIFVSDKHYNPHNLDTETGSLFVYDTKTGALKVLVSSKEFSAPGTIAFAPNNKLYFIDADSNPNKYRGTPGVLFEVDRSTGAFETLIEFKETASPVGLIELPDKSLIVIDANADLLKKEYYLGGLLRVYPNKKTYEFIHLSKKFLDPTRGDLGSDGALYFTDSNADPNKLGPDAVGQGVNGTGPGAIWRYDYNKDELSLVVSANPFVNPMNLKFVPEK